MSIPIYKFLAALSWTARILGGTHLIFIFMQRWRFHFYYFSEFTVYFFRLYSDGGRSAFGFIGALKLTTLWLPKKHFALFAGIATAFRHHRHCVADILSSQIVVVFGWRQAVYLTIYIGLGLTVLLFLLIRNKPS
ncbi:hypothetical protein [Coxiella endosymbiont of Ornithodoros amblus]|uniref:hypothetical protein n=1 Tax=Coxiella endosymbiont of Ornithodoros amblus TaxID=1656166 RepID=UPI003CC75E6C